MVEDYYSPSNKTVSFGAAPDPYSDPAGFAAWYNNVWTALHPSEKPTFSEWNKSQSSPVITDKSAAGYSQAAKKAAFAQYKSLYPETNPLETTEYVFERPQDAGLLTDYVNEGKLTGEAVKANIASDPLYYANVLAGTQAGIGKNSATGNSLGLNTKSIGGLLLPSNVETLPTSQFGQLLASQGSGTDYLLTPEQLYGQLYSGDQYKNYVGEAVPDALRSVFGTSDVKLYPNQQIRIVDQNGVIHSGTAAEMAEASQGQFSADALGDKLYAYQVQNPASGDWSTVYTHVPEGPSWLENFAMMAGPALGAALLPMFAPGLMGLSSAGTAALGAGLGSTAAGAATGKGIGDIAKNAALSAALTYAGGSLFGGGSPTGSTGLDQAGNVVSGGASGLGELGDIIVTGTRSAAPVLGGFAGSLTPSFFDNANLSNEGGSSAGATQPGEIVVTGTRLPTGPAVGGAVGTNLFNPYQSYNPESIQTRTTVDNPNNDDILVTAQREIPDWIKDIALTAGVFAPAAAVAGSSAGAAGSATDATISANTQNAVDNAYFNAQQGAAEALSPTYGGAAAGAGAGAATKGLAALSTADKIRLALAAGSAISGIVDSIGGSDGGGSLGPNGGKYDVTPLNRAQNLRAPVGVGLGDYGFDPFTYGQADGGQPGEYLFFSPTAATGLADGGGVGYAEGGEPSDDMLKHLIEYRKGGGHHGPGAVKGIGSGQDDKIPAWLSDGEYVWSAQDVADLGDGSTDEGVRRLDKMRQMVRKQAGRKNVKQIAKPQKGINHLLSAVGGK